MAFKQGELRIELQDKAGDIQWKNNGLYRNGSLIHSKEFPLFVAQVAEEDNALPSFLGHGAIITFSNGVFMLVATPIVPASLSGKTFPYVASHHTQLLDVAGLSEVIEYYNIIHPDGSGEVQMVKTMEDSTTVKELTAKYELYPPGTWKMKSFGSGCRDGVKYKQGMIAPEVSLDKVSFSLKKVKPSYSFIKIKPFISPF